MSYYPPAPPGCRGRQATPPPPRPDAGRTVGLVLLILLGLPVAWLVVCVLAVAGLFLAPALCAALGVWLVVHPRKPKFRRSPPRRARPPVHAPRPRPAPTRRYR